MDKINFKSIVFFLPLAVLIAIGINYFFLSDEEINEIKQTNETIPKVIVENKIEPIIQVKEKIVTKTIVKYIDKNDTSLPKDVRIETKEPAQNIFVDDIQDYDIQTKDKETILTTRQDTLKKYTISLKTKKTITSTLPSGGYIMLNGIINSDGEQSSFSLSFNEYYANFSDDLLLTLTNNKTNITTSCNGSFLNGVNSDYNYKITLDNYGDMLTCYIASQDDNSHLKKVLNNKNMKSMEELDTSKIK